MKDVILWGGTGQAKVLAEALDPEVFRVCAVVDRREIETPLPGVPLLAGEAGLRAFIAGQPLPAEHHFAVAIGGANGRDRLELSTLLRSLGLAPLTVIHPRAFVARDARVGESAQVLAMAAVCTQAVLGRCVIINTAASIDHDCRIGAGVHVAPGAHLAGEVHVGDCAFIGTGAVVLPRIRIGAHAVVGAGAVVTRDVPDNAKVAGNPARILAKP